MLSTAYIRENLGADPRPDALNQDVVAREQKTQLANLYRISKPGTDCQTALPAGSDATKKPSSGHQGGPLAVSFLGGTLMQMTMPRPASKWIYFAC